MMMGWGWSLAQRWLRHRWLSLTTVVVIGIVLRTLWIDHLPEGLFRDEAWSAVKAMSLLNGRDLLLPYFPENDGVDAANAYLIALLFLITGPLALGNRMVAVTASSLTLLGTYWVAWELLAEEHRRHEIALAATFVLATLFWALTTSRSTWMVMPMGVTLTFSIAALSRGRRLKRSRWFCLAGILAGLCQYTYLGARALLLLLPVIGLMDGWTRRTAWRQVLVHYAWLLAGAGVVCAPLGWFFVNHPEMLFHHAGQVAVLQPPALIDNVLKTLAAFAFRGDENVLHNLPGRPALDPILSVLFMVGLVNCLVRRRFAHSLLLAWIIVLTLPVALAEFAPMFRRWVGILPAEAILTALGAVTLAEIARERFRGHGPGSVGPAVIAGSMLISAGISIATYFGPYASHPDLFYAYDAGITQVARYIAARREAIFLTPIDRFYEPVDIILAEARHPPIQSYNGLACQVFPALTEQETEWVVVTEKDGETLPFIQRVFPAAYLVWQLESPRGVYARAMRVPAGQTARFDLEYRRRANLGDKVELVGFNVDSSVRAGRTLSVTLALRGLTPLDRPYKVFVHLLDDQNVLLAQDDRLPCHFTLNEQDWRPGNFVLETYNLSVPVETSSGDYRIAWGMYDPASNQRLPVIASELEHTADLVILKVTKVSRSHRKP